MKKYLCKKLKFCIDNSHISMGIVVFTLLLQTYMIARSVALMWDINTLNQQVQEDYYRLKYLRKAVDNLGMSGHHIARYAFSPTGDGKEKFCSHIYETNKDLNFDFHARAFILADKASSDIFEFLDKTKKECSKGQIKNSKDKILEVGRFFEALSNRTADFSLEKFTLNNEPVTVYLKSMMKKLVYVSASISCLIYLLIILIYVLMKGISEEMTVRMNEILKLKEGVDQTPLPVVITDTEGAITYINSAFSETYEFTLEEALGKNPRVIKSPNTKPEVYKNLWKKIKAGEKWTGQFENLSKSGKKVMVQAYITPIKNNKNEMTHFMGIHRDITIQNMLMNDLVEARREADAANEAKSDFLSSMSHEIRTPLNAIVGMSDLLDEAPLSTEHKRYLEILRSASDSLLALVNDILDISKIESGKVELEYVDFNLEEMAYKICEMISIKASQKNIEVICHISPDTPVKIVGDPTRLRQVLMNFIGNSIKFVEKGWVSLGISKLKEQGDKVSIRFEIADTGIGIPQDKISKIFDKFTQAEKSTTRKYGGTGLGLPISKMLIEMMGGHVRVASQEGDGATFSFILDFKISSTDKELFIEKADIKELKGIKVLVIDDNSVNRIIVKEILNAYGAITVDAANAKDGLARIKENDEKEPFKIVYMDFNMPDMDGYLGSKNILESSEIKNKPKIVLFTSDTIKLKKDMFRALGINDFLIKPVKRQALVDMTLHMLGKTAAEKDNQTVKDIVYSREDLPALRVLIVDDSEDNRTLMASFLKNSKVEVSFAEDGLIAVDKFKSDKYDVIFMDMQMPNMDGMSAMLEIRKIEKEKNISKTPIVALTAMALKSEIDKAMKSGFDDYLTKPIRKNTFYSYLINFKNS